MFHGLKTLFKDGKWVVSHQVKSQQSAYSDPNYFQEQKV